MITHKLNVDDFYDSGYKLFAIHTNLSDYRLAYSINKQLGTRLSRKELDLDFQYLTSSYSIYEWEDEVNYNTWNLISNKCKVEEPTLYSTGSLFSSENLSSYKTHNLLPQYKNVDFFIKISYQEYFKDLHRVVAGFQQIPNIITSYQIDNSKIKTKEHLIF